MKHIVGFLLVSVLIGASMTQAQVVLPDRGREVSLHQSVFGLGLGAGPVSGLGLSFRHHLPSQFSYQITGGIIKVDNKISSDIGAEGQFDLGRGETARFFVAAGIGYFYSGTNDRNRMDAPWRMGAGIGGEVVAGSGFHFSAELMFVYFNDGNVLPLPQFGLYYYFY